MMKSVMQFRPFSMSVRLSLTCLIISALSLQIGSGAANSILAKSLEPATELNSAPIVILEPATPRPVAYRSMVINKGEAPKVLTQLKSEIGAATKAVLQQPKPH